MHGLLSCSLPPRPPDRSGGILSSEKVAIYQCHSGSSSYLINVAINVLGSGKKLLSTETAH